MGLNEGGTRGDIALHTKLAVLSLRRHTSLTPYLLYMGERNNFTRWLEDRGVRIIDSPLPYLPFIEALAAEKLYSTVFAGHWLRTNICLTEQEDEYVLYTDIDVLYRKDPELTELKPRYLAAAPEFDKKCWDYFNSGVMVQNIPSLRNSYRYFERYLIANLCGRTYDFHDQIAYNEFYRDRWEQLPVELNWKPYWGHNKKAQVLHFHGPKFGPMREIVNGRWDWTNKHRNQLASLFVKFHKGYLVALDEVKAYLPELDASEQDELNDLFEKSRCYNWKQHDHEIDLLFTKQKMFGGFSGGK